MNRVFPMLAQRMFNTPLALHPRKAEVALAALAERLGIATIERGAGGRRVAFEDDWDTDFEGEARIDAGYDRIGPLAMIQAEGMLVQKLGSMRPYSGMTGYDGMRAAAVAAFADPEVRAVVLDVNSGGGEVSGCFELADFLYGCRSIKPIWAICSDHAYSAAYALASACHRVIVPRLGGVGSVGVITMIVDYSKAITASGLAVHFVHYGAAKAEEMRQMHTGVKPELLDRIASDIRVMGDLFTESVARYRGLAVSAVRAQQAEYYLGAKGVEAGLADAVMAPDEAIESLLASLH